MTLITILKNKSINLKREEINMKKQYVIARYFRGWHVETMCEPTTKKDADKRCAKFQKEASPLTEYKVIKIATTRKKVTLI